jgi:hypothetical protein
METRLMSDIVTDELMQGAVLINGFKGFLQDYSVLHCLLKIYNPKSVFEIGTSVGDGTNLITNALPNAKVYSLDLPFGEGDKPLYQNGKDHVGINCKRPFTQLRGDSTTFDYSLYPCEFFYIDAGHFYDNVVAETKAVLKLKPKVIAFHDSDIPEVMQGIEDGVRSIYGITMNTEYDLIRVVDTRISYLILKDYK